ncbi:hypothetical protein [uncultured Lamprocystis sp.]|jgi:hypothetical protein|uniref:hypothetical protein n=1 Tax=uncultured Lamprocystis sp. TaxID=543132 RepID=UPI0025D70DB5|nr:hypothetical protein [uncultured Lamprocystis sp.]
MKRVNVKAILADADLRRKLMVSTIQATQAREGIETTAEQADRAYYVVTEGEMSAFFNLEPYRGGKLTEGDKRHEMFVRSLDALGRVRFDVPRRDFATIDGAPLAYKQLSLVFALFRENPTLGEHFASVQGGMNSTESERFIRYRWEVMSGMRKWMSFSKGGAFSRFYADLDLVMDWTDSGSDYKDVVKEKYGSASRFVKSEAYYGKPGITWTEMTSKGLNARRLPEGVIFNCKGPCAFPRAEEDADYLLAVLNSSLAQMLMNCLTSRSYGSTYVARLPVPDASRDIKSSLKSMAIEIFNAKERWDIGNEVAGTFQLPWALRRDLLCDEELFGKKLDRLATIEQGEQTHIRSIYAKLDDEVYRIYGITDSARKLIEGVLGERPPEVLWPQMEGKTAEQKRMEHVWRLLSYAVKRVLEADDDGIVPFNAVNGEPRLVERVRHELAELFPDRDASQVEVEIVNELNQTVKGYRRCASLDAWLDNAFFEYHCGLYKNRPIFWHIASAQGTARFAFGALIHYHRFDRNRLAKLRATYLRDAIEEFRREASLADKAGATADRLEWQAKLEEAQALDVKLQAIQEGHHEGAEGGDRDLRILTPWKTSEERPNGWDPDLDDGVKVNIEPLQKAGVLRVAKVV